MDTDFSIFEKEHVVDGEKVTTRCSDCGSYLLFKCICRNEPKERSIVVSPHDCKAA